MTYFLLFFQKTKFWFLRLRIINLAVPNHCVGERSKIDNKNTESQNRQWVTVQFRTFVASIHFQKSFENSPESPIVLPKPQKDDPQSARSTNFGARSFFALELFQSLGSSSSFFFFSKRIWIRNTPRAWKAEKYLILDEKMNFGRDSFFSNLENARENSEKSSRDGRLISWKKFLKRKQIFCRRFYWKRKKIRCLEDKIRKSDQL